MFVCNCVMCDVYVCVVCVGGGSTRVAGKVTINAFNNQRNNGLKFWLTINGQRTRIG